MDGLGRASGAGTTVEVNGKVWILAPMKLVDFGMVEQHLLDMQKSPLDAIVSELDKYRDNPELRRELLDRAYADMKKSASIRKLPVAQVQEYIDSIDGIIYTTWISLHKNHPEATMNDARAVFEKMGHNELERLERMKQLRDQLSGLDGVEQNPSVPPIPAGASQEAK